MRVRPDTHVSVAAAEAVTIELDAASPAAGGTVSAGGVTTAFEGNAVTLPSLPAPSRARVDWDSGGGRSCSTYVEVVSRHYFELDELRGYGDGQDDFADMPEEPLALARQAATEVFERAAHRSFVRRIGRTKDYGLGGALNLDHGDVEEIETPGYALADDSTAVRTSCAAYPRWVEYVYGLDEVPAQVSRAVLELAAYMLRPSNRPIGATGESTDAGFIRFTTAGQDGATDIPEVNAAIQQFGRGSRTVW